MLRWLGDLVSPPACAACDERLAYARRVFCPACSNCVERLSSNDARVIAFGLYGGALASAIRRLKYHQRPDLARPLGSLLRHACRDAHERADVVIPVPLHKSRLAARGYNQAALLGRYLAIEMGARMHTMVLVRPVDTVSQAELGREERKANVADAFAVQRPDIVRGRTIALVDDVTTTGATLDACSRALLAARARQVRWFVLASAI